MFDIFKNYHVVLKDGYILPKHLVNVELIGIIKGGNNISPFPTDIYHRNRSISSRVDGITKIGPKTTFFIFIDNYGNREVVKKDWIDSIIEVRALA